MDLKLFGFKFRLEILLLIVVVYWIMAGHLACSCSKFPLMEGFKEGLATITGKKPDKGAKPIATTKLSSDTKPVPYTNPVAGAKFGSDAKPIVKVTTKK
jgi:hypothetical protein